MILALTGLHGSGKSHISRILQNKFGWSYLNKRELLEKYYGVKFTSPESSESLSWYQGLYQTVGATELMSLVLSFIADSSMTILDAVHNPIEWDVVKRTGKRSILVGVFAPQGVRNARNSALDAVLDCKRVGYWHQNYGDDLRCLMSEIEWSFTGAHDEELQMGECRALMSYLGLV